jgi:hypothetical protein
MCIDTSPLGTACIDTDTAPYEEKVILGQTGYLGRNEPNQWVAAITRLLSDAEMRTSIYLNARNWCLETCFNQTIGG